MDQRINSVVYFKVLSETMKLLLSVSPSKVMGDPAGIEPMIVHSTD